MVMNFKQPTGALLTFLAEGSSFVIPGIASIFPPSAGTQKEWMTSQSGAVISSRTVRSTGSRIVSKETAPLA